MDLQIVADGRHSVPTHLRIEADGQPVASVPIPAIADRTGAHGADAVTTVPIDLPQPVTGTDIRFVFDGVRELTTIDWFSNAPVRMPIGIAELGVPELSAAVPSGSFDTGCRLDLLDIDGTPVGVDIAGTVADATSGKPLQGEPVRPLRRRHLPRQRRPRVAGNEGGGRRARPRLARHAVGAGRRRAHRRLRRSIHRTAAGPTVKVDGQSRTSFDLSVTGATTGPAVLARARSEQQQRLDRIRRRPRPRQTATGRRLCERMADRPGRRATSRSRCDGRRNATCGSRWRSSLVGALLCLFLAIRRPRAVALAVDDPSPGAVHVACVRHVSRHEQPSAAHGAARRRDRRTRRRRRHRTRGRARSRRSRSVWPPDVVASALVAHDRFARAARAERPVRGRPSGTTRSRRRHSSGPTSCRPSTSSAGSRSRSSSASSSSTGCGNERIGSLAARSRWTPKLLLLSPSTLLFQTTPACSLRRRRRAPLLVDAQCGLQPRREPLLREDAVAQL